MTRQFSGTDSDMEAVPEPIVLGKAWKRWGRRLNCKKGVSAGKVVVEN